MTILFQQEVRLILTALFLYGFGVGRMPNVWQIA